MQSISGDVFTILPIDVNIRDNVNHINCKMDLLGSKLRYLSQIPNIERYSSSLGPPCLLTKSSNLSFLRPTAVTLAPACIKRSAIAAPMPAVAPINRTCLYGNSIVAEM